MRYILPSLAVTKYCHNSAKFIKHPRIRQNARGRAESSHRPTTSRQSQDRSVLRSSNTTIFIFLPTRRSMSVRCAFPVAAWRAWNSLSLSTWKDTLTTFPQQCTIELRQSLSYFSLLPSEHWCYWCSRLLWVWTAFSRWRQFGTGQAEKFDNTFHFCTYR